MRGDYRALYLSWLLAVQSESVDDDTLEPPVPPGLGNLSASLDRLADFLRIDDDLIATAAEHSLSEQVAELTKEEIGAWLLNLSSREKDSILLRLIDGADPHLAVELRRRAIIELRSTGEPVEAPRRTAGDIIARAKILTETRRKKEAEQRSREKARHEQEQAEKRRKHLDSLSGKEKTLWAKVDELIATKLANRYNEAVSILQDLRDLAAMKGQSADFSSRMRALHNEHARKPSLNERLRKAKLDFIHFVAKPSKSNELRFSFCAIVSLMKSRACRGCSVKWIKSSLGKIAGVSGYNLIDMINGVGHIGYWLAQEYNGKGIMTESVRNLIGLGFNYYLLNRIEIRCAVENRRSQAIPERLGFRKLEMVLTTNLAR